MVGNAHLEHSPLFDHVKYAQAVYFLETVNDYLRANSKAEESIPFISGGDFNALPISSVLSAFYLEDIESKEEEKVPSSIWRPSSDTTKETKQIYKSLNKRLKEAYA